MMSETKKCLECGGVLNPIRVIDHAHGFEAGELTYTSPERSPSLLGSFYQELGRVKAWMCDDCGAIRLYGEPKKKQ
jgi:hypothetical protein